MATAGELPVEGLRNVDMGRCQQWLSSPSARSPRLNMVVVHYETYVNKHSCRVVH